MSDETLTTANDNTDAVESAETKVETTETEVTTEVKAEETKQETKQEEAKADDKPAVPEKYEFAIEGMEIDQQAIEQFTPIAKKLGLSQEQANELVQLHAAQAKAWAEKFGAELQEEYNKGLAEIQNDPKIGGKAYKENLGKVNNLLQKYGQDFSEASLRQVYGDKALFSCLLSLANAANPHQFITGQAIQSNGPELYPGLPNTR